MLTISSAININKKIIGIVRLLILGMMYIMGNKRSLFKEGCKNYFNFEYIALMGYSTW